MMEIVIKIPDVQYENMAKIAIAGKEPLGYFERVIMWGTPLPKGHGRLVDADAYRKELLLEIPNLDYDGSLEPYEEGIYNAIMSLDDAPTIIEAEGSENV